MLGFGSLGWGEIVIIMVALLLLFGAKRLPEIGQSLGKGIREFKNSLTSSSDEEAKLSSGDQSEVETQRKREEAS
ncbi:MAG: twin-arginine translocase TatA/TatE family subunit [Gemmatimonadota bacterium]|jgi:sec-independent protein translocase protein TatA